MRKNTALDNEQINKIETDVERLMTSGKPFGPRDLLSPPTERLNAQLREYVTFGASILGVQDPKALPPVIIANRWESMIAAGITNPDDELFGAFFPNENGNAEFLMIRDDIADGIEAGDAVKASVIVHELAHYVAFHTGLDKPDFEDKRHRDISNHETTARSRKAEKDAYTVQGHWLWDLHQINPRLMPAFDPKNLEGQTGDVDFASLHWLNGYSDDSGLTPDQWNSFWRARKQVAGDIFTADPRYSIAAFKEGAFTYKEDPLQALLKSLISSDDTLNSIANRWNFLSIHRGEMDDLDAILIAEGGAKDASEYIAAFQHLVDNGMVWKLQGWYGRTAQDLINRGEVTLPDLEPGDHA